MDLFKNTWGKYAKGLETLPFRNSVIVSRAKFLRPNPNPPDLHATRAGNRVLSKLASGQNCYTNPREIGAEKSKHPRFCGRKER